MFTEKHFGLCSSSFYIQFCISFISAFIFDFFPPLSVLVFVLCWYLYSIYEYTCVFVDGLCGCACMGTWRPEEASYQFPWPLSLWSSLLHAGCFRMSSGDLLVSAHYPTPPWALWVQMSMPGCPACTWMLRSEFVSLCLYASHFTDWAVSSAHPWCSDYAFVKDRF